MDVQKTLFQYPQVVLPLALALAFVVYRYQQSKTGLKALPRPPGPKPHWLLGNALDMPLEQPWKKFREWCNLYGDVIYLDLPMQPTVVLGSAKAINDLMEKRSHIYSDRKVTVMDHLTYWDWDFGFMGYNAKWRKYRKMFHQHFAPNVIPKYHHIQTQQARAYIRRMLDNPNGAVEEIRLCFAANIVKVTYGMDLKSMDDEYIHWAHKANEGLSKAKVPGAYWIEYFPFLQWIPAWVPGASFAKLAKEYRPYAEKMVERPFNRVRDAADNGIAIPSIMYSLIKEARETFPDRKSQEEYEIAARDSLGVAYAAGFDTTTIAGRGFLLGIAINQDFQRRAQAELDAVVGPNRLPDFNDFDQLPTIRAIVLEAMRWRPVTPFAIPHQLMEDDEYNGYYIPKGATVIGNSWAILHDEKDYPDPESFKPERFLTADGKLNPEIRDPTQYTFGFGRRMCPGRFFSNDSLWITVATVLHTFNIEAVVDKNGKPADLIAAAEPVSGFLSGPTDVPVVFKPRSENAIKLIHDTANESW
ncbi:cytochrome P450 [Panus rudis PR-1116 ss-1]|nr:cytochrome P450 [Panus rudis PR-1116 ss-1]